MTLAEISQLERSQTLMFKEAAEAWRAVEAQQIQRKKYARLADRLRRLAPTMVFTCARGSSGSAAAYGSFLIERFLGLPVVAQAPSMASIYGDSLLRTRGSPILIISQSGRSPDLLRTANAAKAAGALVVAVVNDEASPLADIADEVVPLLAGTERSVAATKSYIASLSAIASLITEWSGHVELRTGLDGLSNELCTAWERPWRDDGILVKAQSALVLGRGATISIAQEAALKLKETSAIHAEAFSIAEVAHGPMELVGPKCPVLVMTPDDAATEGLDALLQRFAARGADVLRVERGVIASRLPVAELHPCIAPIAMIQSFYRLANDIACSRGRDPDQPTMLSKVTETI